jgi:hypothetical protein
MSEMTAPLGVITCIVTVLPVPVSPLMVDGREYTVFVAELYTNSWFPFPSAKADRLMGVDPTSSLFVGM